MRKTATTLATGLAALACAGFARAHHSGYMYQTTPIWISGAVIRFDLKNPHTIITLEDRSQNGEVRLWAVEGPSQTEIDRMNINDQIPKVGDTIAVCAFPYRSAEEIARDPRIGGGDGSTRRSSPTTDGSSPQFVAGHVIKMTDGEMRFWEPHGFIAECLRGSDANRQAWVDLLNANPRAREYWCKGRRSAAVQANESFIGLVEAIDGSLYEPCK